MINTILFDLDGTLLPLDMDRFTQIYFGELGKTFQDVMDPKQLIENIWASTEVMVKNTELRTNEDVFMNHFASLIDDDLSMYMDRFNNFYDTDFSKVREAIFEVPFIKESVTLLKEKGYDLVVATNPLFPRNAIEHRICWAGFEPENFIYVASYEKNHYCKPQIQYYQEILESIQKDPKECMMVGNDMQEDMIAGKLGMDTYLINDYVIDRKKADITPTYKGSYEDFYEFVKHLPSLK